MYNHVPKADSKDSDFYQSTSADRIYEKEKGVGGVGVEVSSS